MIPIRDRNPSGTFPVVTLVLIVLNALVFVFELGFGREGVADLFMTLGVRPFRARLALEGQVGQGVLFGISLFTSMFLHGGWLHLIGNMWYLWIFGDNVEDRLGHGRFVAFYLLCGIAAALAHTVFNFGSKIPTVGASGAIAGVLGAYLITFPRARVVTLVPIFYFVTFVELPAVIVLGAWFFIQLLNQSLALAAPGAFQGVAWMAHIGGFVAGIGLMKIMAKRRTRRQRVPRY
jgi:membrane associated rhomboid family serine protease